MFSSSPSVFCSHTGVCSNTEAGPWYNTSLPCHPLTDLAVCWEQFSRYSFPKLLPAVCPSVLFFCPLVPCTGKEDPFHLRLILEEVLRTKKDLQEESLKESLAWVSPSVPQVCLLTPEHTVCWVQVSSAMVLVEGRPCV